MAVGVTTFETGGSTSTSSEADVFSREYCFNVDMLTVERFTSIVVASTNP